MLCLLLNLSIFTAKNYSTAILLIHGFLVLNVVSILKWIFECENTEPSKAIHCCKFRIVFRRHACLYGEQEILDSSFIFKGRCQAHVHS